MAKIRFYYNPDCPNCVRQAQLTARVDWLGRVELITEDSPLGVVPIGEIVVVEKQSDRIFTGIYATRKVCLQVPAFFLYGVVLYIPFLRKKLGGRKPGCDGDACEV